MINTPPIMLNEPTLAYSYYLDPQSEPKLFTTCFYFEEDLKKEQLMFWCMPRSSSGNVCRIFGGALT